MPVESFQPAGDLLSFLLFLPFRAAPFLSLTLLAFFLFNFRAVPWRRVRPSCFFSASSSANTMDRFGREHWAGCCRLHLLQAAILVTGISRPSSALCMLSLLGFVAACVDGGLYELGSLYLSILVTLWKAFSRFFRLAPPPVNTTPEKVCPR